MADISPDGRLVAYQSAEPNERAEVYVETFPVKGSRWQVSVAGGFEPIWRADGREIFFRDPEGRLVAVEVHRDGARGVRFGAPQVLFTPSPNMHWSVRIYAPFPDGQRFVIVTEAARPAPQKLTAIVNWRSALPPD
jgi:eukaryotic-like serine/threonine-protein kinase